MSPPQQLLQINTSYGRLAVRAVGSGKGIPLFCIHGNSGSSKIFKHVFESSIPTTRPVYAVDLLGHGESQNAEDPDKGYTMPGYARACVEVLEKLGHKEAVVVGWSMGGHVATEMLPLFAGMKGIVIVGSYLLPYFPDGPPENPRSAFMMKDGWTDEEAIGFSKSGCKGPWEEWMGEAAIRTDYRARQVLFKNLGYGDCSDQRELIANTKVPTQLFVGTEEPHHPVDGIKALKYGGLYGEINMVEGGEHCPIWEYPEVVIPKLEQFLADVA